MEYKLKSYCGDHEFNADAGNMTSGGWSIFKCEMERATTPLPDLGYTVRPGKPNNTIRVMWFRDSDRFSAQSER